MVAAEKRRKARKRKAHCCVSEPVRTAGLELSLARTRTQVTRLQREVAKRDDEIAALRQLTVTLSWRLQHGLELMYDVGAYTAPGVHDGEACPLTGAPSLRDVTTINGDLVRAALATVYNEH